MTGTNKCLLAGLAAGFWIVLSGMLMAGLFGYREMQAAFDAHRLAIPTGIGSMVLHACVRLAMGFAIATVYAMLRRSATRGRALVASSGLVWLLSIVLPYAVIADWGLLPWMLVAKLWAWEAVQFLIAGIVAQLIYR
jgi:hypothetical protein